MYWEVYLQNNVGPGQWANRVNDLRLHTPFNNRTHIKNFSILNPPRDISACEMQAHLSRGIQVGSAAPAQAVRLADSEQRGRQNGAKVIEGPASHSLRLLRHALGLR